MKREKDQTGECVKWKTKTIKKKTTKTTKIHTTTTTTTTRGLCREKKY